MACSDRSDLPALLSLTDVGDPVFLARGFKRAQGALGRIGWSCAVACLLTACDRGTPEQPASPGTGAAPEVGESPLPPVVPAASGLSSAEQPAVPQAAPDWARGEEHNRGTLCLSADSPADALQFVNAGRRSPPQVELLPGTSLFAVFRGVCLNSCERHGQARCSVERSGTVLAAKLDVQFERTTQGPCTDFRQCTPAVCRVPPLEAGSYTLRYGDDTLALEVPSSGKLKCLPGAGAPQK